MDQSLCAASCSPQRATVDIWFCAGAKRKRDADEDESEEEESEDEDE